MSKVEKEEQFFRGENLNEANDKIILTKEEYNRLKYYHDILHNLKECIFLSNNLSINLKEV